MTIIGTQQTGKPNIVNLKTDLPLQFSKGNISVSLNFEQHPTGTITIIHVPETDIDKYRDEYQVIGRPLTLFSETSRPIFFEISAYAETEDAIFIDDTFSIKTYDIAVSLRGGHERKVNQPYKVNKPKNSFLMRIASPIYGGGRSTFTFSNFVNPIPTDDIVPYNLTSRIKNNKINLTDFASLVDVAYSGYSYAINIPSDAGSEYTLSFNDVLQRKLRVNSQIVDFTGPTIKTRNYKKGTTWQISDLDILYSLELAKQQPYEYQNTVLSGKDGLPFLSNAQLRKKALSSLLGDQTQRKPPVETELVEGDEDPENPPPDVKELNTLDMNFDFSGPRKTKKVTKYLNGQPFEEELFVYGFAYLGQDIRNPEAEDVNADFDTPALKTTSPDNYWTLIEYKKTTYIYEEADVSIRLKAQDTFTGEILPVFYISSKNSNVTRFNNKYLTGITTTGWKINRFQQEQFDEQGSDLNTLDSRWLADEINITTDPLEERFLRAQLDTVQFRKIPYISRTQYHLAPITDYYDDLDNIPFRTSEYEKEDLGLSGSGSVLVALPDPSYVFPMLVLEERTLTQSFAQIDHPQNIIIRDERNEVQNNTNLTVQEKEDELKDLKLLPWLTTGEDTYEATIRKIQPSQNTTKKVGTQPDIETDIYVEYAKNASNQDAKFQYSLQEGKFRTIAGRPPTATVFSYEFEDSSGGVDNTDFNYEYQLSSTNDRYVTAVDSVQYETSDFNEGLAAAKADLEINNFLNVYEDSINLAWFYPDIRPGDYIEFLSDYSKGKRRVKSVSFTVDYQGHVNGSILTTCNGTSLTTGKFEDKDIESKKVRKTQSQDDTNIETVVNGEEVFGIDIYPNIRTRRNPGGKSI